MANWKQWQRDTEREIMGATLQELLANDDKQRNCPAPDQAGDASVEVVGGWEAEAGLTTANPPGRKATLRARRGRVARGARGG